jgi:hypothetical protein
MPLTELVQLALKDSVSYTAYRAQIQQHIQQAKSKPDAAADPMLAYTELNEVRMRRLDKTLYAHDALSWPNSTFRPIALCITEGWCGDAAQQIPVLALLEKHTQAFDLRLVARDAHLGLMDQFLTQGNRAIPMVLWLHPVTFEVLSTYGPRPQTLQNWVQQYKIEHGIVDEAAKIYLQQWYTQDKGIHIQQELAESLQKGLDTTKH